MWMDVWLKRTPLTSKSYIRVLDCSAFRNQSEAHHSIQTEESNSPAVPWTWWVRVHMAERTNIISKVSIVPNFMQFDVEHSNNSQTVRVQRRIILHSWAESQEIASEFNNTLLLVNVAWQIAIGNRNIIIFTRSLSQICLFRINLFCNFSLSGVYFLQTNHVKTFAKGMAGAADAIINLEDGAFKTRLEKAGTHLKDFVVKHCLEFVINEIFAAIIPPYSHT